MKKVVTASRGNNSAAEYLPREDELEPDQAETLALLKSREFNPDSKPPLLRSVFTLNGTTICTPGNITTITSSVKTGKTAVVGALAAAAMPHAHDADLLGFESSNAGGKALLWFDSEQSPDDFWNVVQRAAQRAGQPKPPAWLHAYCLTGLGVGQAWECLTEALRVAAAWHGGIHSVLLDGAADFVADVNDAAEANDFVAALHGLGIEHDCPFVGVIHFNPGSDKSRGHLGSQLERKAETNLALDKDKDEAITIYSTKNRRASIPKEAKTAVDLALNGVKRVVRRRRDLMQRQAAKRGERDGNFVRREGRLIFNP